MPRITHWVDDVLACDDGELDDDLFDRIVARGAAADGGGLAPYHALELLAALPPDDATIVRLVESVCADPDAVEVDDIVMCLVAAGPAATPLVSTALAATDDPAAARAFAEALAGGETRDGGVTGALLAAFSRFPGDVAPSLGDYGDATALPALHTALGAHFVGAGSSEDSDEDALAMAQAITDLGGELTADEETKRDLAVRRQNRRLARDNARRPEGDEPAAAPPPRPNDPCPCGSGRKFKKCCEGEGV
jgi:hypothetical protein